MSQRIAAAMVVLLMLGGGCAARHGRPVVGGSVVPDPTGTVSGDVTSISGMPIEGRRISAIDMATGTHYDATTSKTGGYTIKVPPGKYRLQVELRSGERLTRQPDEDEVNIGDLDEALDFVIAG